MTYQPHDRHGAAVETMTFDLLRERNDRTTQRADFHVVALIDSGHGRLTVDFHKHQLRARTAVWINPGAVHRWDDIASLGGHLALFVPTAPVTRATRELAATPDLAVTWQVPDGSWPYVDAARNHLVLETRAPADDVLVHLPQILLSALITRLRPPRSGPQAASAVFEQFRASVEAHFRRHHDVGYYARALGYSPRTLSRAAHQVSGQSAKAYLTERIVLEAKRLLAHDRLTAARCADKLGFADGSNFSTFFRTATGMPPGAWQALMR